ncbi:MAG: MarR family transcriptional regulator [Paracholeplasma sp.]|jgi:MarR family 2-MHQ and catechol resistance regulon transcriptional repressor|uniref:Transcriptional regulator, MarR family n=1 Tax=Acholeplasma brassicae TaxID=61635 RepID=U4KMG2_9MOLU|nr:MULTISPECIES: MarR family transcriptional regulator [Paracholeplasma]MDY3196349.1 MarR family transcriptional regulator [Paracholeplasma sp.]CCV65285.1 Transcriptional regulator, MarR family [Paracholeplasma brassicae]
MEKNKNVTILFRATGSLQQLVKKDVAKHDLNISEFSTLEVLYAKGALSVQDICDLVLIANSSMSYVLDKLEKRQLISRVKNESDKRYFTVSLTEEGQVFMKKVMKEHLKNIQPVFDVLSKEEQEELKRMLKLVGKKAEELTK